MDNVYVPSTFRRLAARGVDSLIRLFFYFPFVKSFFKLVFTEDEVVISLGQFVLFLMVPALYEFIFLVLMQATPGKWLMGLKVVPANRPFEELHWTQCVLRPLAERLSVLFSWAIYATAFFRYDRTHVADWFAETRVVQFVPRSSRAKLRWFLGSVLVLIYFSEGMTSARHMLQAVDLENQQVNLRSLVEVDGMADLMEEYD